MDRSGVPRLVCYCALAAIAALYVVGFVSHGVLRHFVQTLPLWPAVVLGWRRSPWTKWSALPWAIIWLLLMAQIWSFLFGYQILFGGTFTITEILMTIIVGGASLVAILASLGYKTGVRVLGAVGVFALVTVLQVACLYVSFFPSIAHD